MAEPDDPGNDEARSQGELRRIRDRADALARRALADPKFRDELKADPRRILEREGLPAGAAEDVARELGIDASPDLGCRRTCFFSCVWSCAGTG
jgi:hypothetical protein